MRATTPAAAKGRYRARDLLLPASLLSFLRLPLAALFPFVVDDPPRAFTVLLAAGLSDVLDGFVARRFRQETAVGAALDGIADKAFALTVCVTLLVVGRISVVYLLALSARELLEAPLVVWYATSRRARGTRAERPVSNVAGKAATVVQFAAVAAAILGAPHLLWWAAAAAVAGTFAGFTYWRRTLRAARASLAEEARIR
jgi:CDP-diacylglycerol--glycerol-3-phosphate 3-phosphatidyltransferase/cardiolipin synthase